MPAVRKGLPAPPMALPSKKSARAAPVTVTVIESLDQLKALEDDLPPLKADGIAYPTSEVEREQYRTKSGKRVTPHQWAVYDFTLKIPAGKVVRYKDICTSLGTGSPRSVGSALRNNPFAPYIPCHRIVASDYFVGGYSGQWGEGHKVNRKLQLLTGEGVKFDAKGYVDGGERYLWKSDVGEA